MNRKSAFSMVLLVVVFLPCAATFASDSATPACMGHTVDGYYLGMARHDALAVRATETGAEGALVARQPGSVDNLRFDATDRLTMLERTIDEATPAELTRTIAATLGSDPKEHFEDPAHAPAGQPRVLRASWQDKACGQQVDVLYTYTASGARATVRMITLPR